MRILISIFLTFYLNTLFAAFSMFPYEPKVIALGGEQITYIHSVSNSMLNPSLGIWDKKTTLSTGYNNPYGARALSNLFASLRIPFRNSVFDFNLRSVSVNLQYYEEEFNISYSRKLTQHLSAGIGLSLYYIYANYEGDSSFLNNYISGSIHFGIIKRIDKFDFSISIRNLNRPYLRLSRNTEEDYKIPSQYCAGLSFKPSEGIWFGATFIKDGAVYSTTAGIEVDISEILFLRMGISDYVFTYGIGFSFEVISFDLGFNSHNFLGTNLAVGLNYEF